MALRYGIAFVAVAAAIAVRLLLDRFLEERFLFAPFLVAVFVASRFGLGPSLLAAGLSVLAVDYLFYPPQYSFTIVGRSNQFSLALNASASLLIVLLAEYWRRRDEVKRLTRTAQGLTREITERQQAEQRQQKAMERIELLSDVASQLLSSDRPQEVVQALCQRVSKHLDCQAFLNFLVEAGHDRLHLNAYGGLSPETARELEWLDYGADGCGWVAQSGQPLILADVPHSIDPRADLVQTLGGTAYACHPLVNQDQMIGTLSFVSQTKTRFSEDEVALMQTVADHVAIAIQRIRLMESIEQRAAEAEEGRRFLEALMDHIPMGIVIADAQDLTVRMMSRFGREMSGWPEEPGATVSLRDIPEHWQVLKADGVTPTTVEKLPLTQAILNGETVREAELTLVQEDGQKIPMLVNAAPIRDASGQIVGGVAGWQDLTHRKQAEEDLQAAREHLELKVNQRTEQLTRSNAALQTEVAERQRVEENLRKRNELLQAVVDHIPVMLTLHDGQHRTVLVNAEFERLVGWSLEEARRMDLPEVLIREPELRRQARDFMKTPEAGWQDFVLTTRWGTTLETAWANIRLSDGTFIGIGLDISERKKAQMQLETLNRALEQRAEQLQAMALELTQSEERERRQLAQVLHDHLQQLLVAARMKMTLLRRHLQDERQGRAIEQVDELLNQCITESRSLTVELSPPVLYDGGLAAGLAWLARQTEEKHGLEVHVQIDPAIEPADQGTKVLLFQVVRELLFNVVKHAQAFRADVEATREDGWLRVEVRDNGVGFEAARLNHHAGTRSGFGLFSIQERLELIGGRLEVDTAPGRGSRMRIVAPLEPLRPAVVERPRERVPVATEEAVSPPSLPQEGKTIRVVLADDHPILRKGLFDVLDEHPGIDIVGEASDGEEVIDLARRTRPDVVVMDVTMPKLSGVEATRRIVAEQPQIRVIGLSMHEQSDMAAAMREAGAAAYLSKSHPTDTLVAMILQPAEATSEV